MNLMNSIGFGAYGDDASKFKGAAPFRLFKAEASIKIDKNPPLEKKDYTVELGVTPLTIILALLAAGSLSWVVYVWKSSRPG